MRLAKSGYRRVLQPKTSAKNGKGNLFSKFLYEQQPMWAVEYIGWT